LDKGVMIYDGPYKAWAFAGKGALWPAVAANGSGIGMNGVKCLIRYWRARTTRLTTRS